MTNPTFIGLINNTALLLALGVMYGFLQHRTKTLGWKLLSGLVLGMICVGLMMNPWQLAPGVFFDTRTILLSVGGLFLGVVPMIPALILSGLYRIYAGGPGALTGVLWVLGSGILGLLWARLRKRPAYEFSSGEYYLFGLIVHLCMLLLMFTMPEEMGPKILERISLPVLLIFPIGTVLLARLLASQELQQRNKLELDTSERKYRELVHNSQAIILRVDAEGRITFFNEYAQRFFGYSEQEIIGRKLIETLLPDDAADGHDLLSMFAAKQNRSGISAGHESDNICRDGRRVRILWNNSPVHNSSGELVGFQSIGHDLTEQRQAEASLREAEQQFHQLIDVSPVPLAILKDNQTITYLNRRFSEVFGYTLDDLETIDSWWLQAYPDPQYRKDVQERWMSAARDAIESNIEFAPQEARVSCKDGTILDVVAMLSSIGSQEIVALHDMSRERQLDRLKSEFMATAAHELNTPLTSIMGFAELMANDDALDRPTQKEYLDVILNKTEVLQQIITDLLALSRAEQGQHIYLEKELCDLHELVVSTLLTHRIEFTDRKFQLDWPEPEYGHIALDRIKIGQLLDNLLGNAIKFSPPGTPIIIRGQQTDDTVRVSISDQGSGLTPEQAAHAFERFYRADASDSAPPGLGLGLTISKEIIESHNGTIELQSEPGRGTTVSFTLPLSD